MIEPFRPRWQTKANPVAQMALSKYNPAALSPPETFGDRIDAKPTRCRSRLNRLADLFASVRPNGQGFARAHPPGGNEQFANHEDRAHAHRRLWSAADRLAESQSRGGVGDQADDRVGSCKCASRTVGLWPCWLAQRKTDGAHDLAHQRRAHLRSAGLDAEHARAGARESLPNDPAGASLAGNVDGVLGKREDEGSRAHRAGGKAHYRSGESESAAEAPHRRAGATALRSKPPPVPDPLPPTDPRSQPPHATDKRAA